MKELIGLAIVLATLFGGTKLARVIHNQVRTAAFEKVGKGIPPLSKLRFPSKSTDKTEN